MRPRLVAAVAVDQPLDLVQDLLGAADTERRDQHRALIQQRALHHLLELQAALAPALVQAVAVGALYHQRVGPVRRARRGQQGRMGRAQVAGEHHPVALRRGLHLALHIGRAEYVPGLLEADVDGVVIDSVVVASARTCNHTMPLAVRHRDNARGNQLDEFLQLARVPGNTHLHRVLQHQRQQAGRRFGADDRPLEPRRQQVGNTPHVVDMHMAHHQRLDMVDGEINGELVCTGAGPGGFCPLEQATVHQHPRATRQAQFMAGAGHAIDRAVVGNLKKSRHGKSLCGAEARAYTPEQANHKSKRPGGASQASADRAHSAPTAMS